MLFFLFLRRYNLVWTRESINFLIRQSCTFVCATSKDWTNAQRVNAPATTILPISSGTYNCLNSFGLAIYAPQTSTYKNIAKPFKYKELSQKINSKDYLKRLTQKINSKVPDYGWTLTKLKLTLKNTIFKILRHEPLVVVVAFFVLLCMGVYMYVCMYVCMCVFVRLCMCVNVYVYMCVCMCL